MTSSKLSYQEQKEHEREVRRAEKRVKTLEQQIADTEAAIAEIERQLSQGNASDPQIFSRHAELNRQLEDVMAEWEQASEDLEETTNSH